MATTLDIAVNSLINKQTELLNLLSTSAATVKRYGPLNAGTISIKPNNNETTTGQTWIFSSLIAKSNFWLYGNLFQYGLTEYRGDSQPRQWSASIFWKCVSNLLIPTPNVTSIGFRINPNVLGVPAGTSNSTDKIGSWITIDSSPVFQTNDFVHTFHYNARFISGNPGNSDIGDFKFLRNTGFLYSAPFVYNHKTSLTYNDLGGLSGFTCQDLTKVNASDQFSSRLEAPWLFGFISLINVNLTVCSKLVNGVLTNNAWNFYAGGNAPNFFLGKVLIGSNIDNGVAKLECSGYGYFENKLFVGANTGTTTGASLVLSFANVQDSGLLKAQNSWNISSLTDSTYSTIKILRLWTLYNNSVRYPASLELRSNGETYLGNSSLILNGIIKPREVYGDYTLAIAHSIKFRGTTSVTENAAWNNSFFNIYNSPSLIRDSDENIGVDLAKVHHIAGINNSVNLHSGLIYSDIVQDNYKKGLDIRWLTGIRSYFNFENKESTSSLRFNIRNDLRSLWIGSLIYNRSSRLPILGSPSATKEEISIGGSIHGVVVDNLIPRGYSAAYTVTVTDRVYGISTWQEKLPGFKTFNFFAGGNAPSYFNGNVKIGNGDLDHSDADNFSANLLKGLDSEDTIAKNYNFEVADFTHLDHLHVFYPQSSTEVIKTYTVSGNFIIFTTTNAHTFRSGETVSVTGVLPAEANGIYIVREIGQSGTGLLANEYNTFKVRWFGSAPGTFATSTGSVSNVSSLVELGHPSVANTPTLDFHCIARSVISNYDVRLQVSEISTAGFSSNNTAGLNGEGRLTILGKEVFFTNSLSKAALRIGNDGTAQIGYHDLSVPGILNLAGTATTGNTGITTSGKLCINGKQVLTNQRPGWGQASDWGNEAATTVSIPSSADATLVTAFKRLVAALITHGILGDSANGTTVTQSTGLRT